MAITTDVLSKYFLDIYTFSGRQSCIYFNELVLGTGWSNPQRADGYLMELWPSKGFERTAFEFKVSRADFLKEIKNPQKRKSIQNFSDYYVIVTANDICKKDEIPADCGWYCFDGKGLNIEIRPPRLPPSGNPCWSFTSSLVRAAYRMGCDRSELGRSESEKELERQLESSQIDLNQALATIDIMKEKI